MQKFLLVIIAISICNLSYATTKCIQTPTNKSSCKEIVGESIPGQPTVGHTPNGTAQCSDLLIEQIGVCSKDPGVKYAPSQYGTIFYSDDLTENKYCWCRMIKPTTSAWIYRYGYTDGLECAINCAGGCTHAITTIQSFLTALFSNLE